MDALPAEPRPSASSPLSLVTAALLYLGCSLAPPAPSTSRPKLNGTSK